MSGRADISSRDDIERLVRAHAPANGRTPFTEAHDGRWVALFCETVDRDVAGPVAETAKERGRRMAKALRRLLDGVDAPGDEPTHATLRPR